MNLKNSESIFAFDLTSDIIANRRNYSAKRLENPGPTQAQINKIFGAAASAPDHGSTTPWRFVLVHQDKRHLLGEAFANALLERDKQALTEDLEKAKTKAFNAPLVALAICNLDKQSAWSVNYERLISLGCAIQNILITATALGFGSGLTSGKAMTSSSIRNLFKTHENEACICFINIGTVSSTPKISRIRPSIGSYLSDL